MLKTLLMTLILACSASPFPALQESEAPQSKLDKVVERHTLSEKDFPRALLKTAQEFKIPMGLEWIRLRSDPKEINLSWRNATVREIVQSIVYNRPGYDLDEEDGIVHVFYAGAKADNKNFLNIKLAKFQSENEYVAPSEQRLHDIVKRTVFPPPPSVPGKVYSEIRQAVVSGGEHKATFEVRNGTVRDVLDRMALATDGKIWVVTFDGRAGLTPTGFRRTINSLWNTFSLPDQYQPAWDFIFVRSTVAGIGLPP